MVNAAIFILTQNTPLRKAHLKTCLYFLFKHFNAAYMYPVRIFHEGDYDAESMREIVMGVRASCRHLVSFVSMDPEEWKVPDWIDEARAQRIVDLKVTPYWRNLKYRLMCRWWVVHMPKHASAFDYVMRLDDDSIIEEPIAQDLFQWAQKSDLVYASNLVHVDCGICCYGMKEFFLDLFPDKPAVLDRMFTRSLIPTATYTLPKFRAFLDTQGTGTKPIPAEGYEIYQPTIMYNNFLITKSAFWSREDVQKTIGAIDLDGRIFYARWGDAPLHTLITAMHADEGSVQRATFAYSKRMQREAFAGDDGCFHSYMPISYTEDSSVV